MNTKPQPQPDLSVDEKNSSSNLHTVTPLSKYLALVLFVVLPFVGGWVGYQIASENNIDASQHAPEHTVMRPDESDGKSAISSEPLDAVEASEWKGATFNFLVEGDDVLVFQQLPYEMGVQTHRLHGVAGGGAYEYLGSGYIKNSEHVIFTGDGRHHPAVLEEADAASFQVLPTKFTVTYSQNEEFARGFARDKNAMYFAERKLQNLNPETALFEKIERGTGSYTVVRDTETVWVPGGCDWISYDPIPATALSTWGGRC